MFLDLHHTRVAFLSINDCCVMAPVAITCTKQTSDAPAKGSVFDGIKFFVLQQCPSRSKLVLLIRANGGEVLRAEQQADYIIADHFRRNCPPGSISYTFIEQSVKHGHLAVPGDHLAGPVVGQVRDVGTGEPTRRVRIPFTAEEDAKLRKWVKRCQGEGMLPGGNVMYQNLEKVVRTPSERELWAPRRQCLLV